MAKKTRIAPPRQQRKRVTLHTPERDTHFRDQPEPGPGMILAGACASLPAPDQNRARRHSNCASRCGRGLLPTTAGSEKSRTIKGSDLTFEHAPVPLDHA